MSRSFKINTAIIIFLAFLFRLLFVNLGIITSLNACQNNNFKKTHYSKLVRKRVSVDALGANSSGTSVVEICENSGDEDELSRHISNPLLFTYSFLTNKMVSIKSDSFFDFIHLNFPSKKYLAISVLRI